MHFTPVLVAEGLLRDGAMERPAEQRASLSTSVRDGHRQGGDGDPLHGLEATAAHRPLQDLTPVLLTHPLQVCAVGDRCRYGPGRCTAAYRCLVGLLWLPTKDLDTFLSV